MFIHLNKFGLRSPAGDVTEAQSLWDDGPEDVIVNDDVVVEDDYDPEIHDDPESPDYRNPNPVVDDPTPSTNVVSTRPNSAAFGPEHVAAAVKAALQSNQQTQQQEPAFDEKAFRKQIGYREVTEADLVSILDPERPAAERAALLQGLFDAREKSVITIANALFQQAQGQVQQVSGHLSEQRRIQARSNLVNDTVKAYPALKEYGDLLPEIFEQLRQSGSRPATPDAAVRSLASLAQKTIKKYNKAFSLQTSQAKPTRAMASSINTGGPTGSPKPVKTEPFNALWD
jgi:hypothetical protein